MFPITVETQRSTSLENPFATTPWTRPAGSMVNDRATSPETLSPPRSAVS